MKDVPVDVLNYIMSVLRGLYFGEVVLIAQNGVLIQVERKKGSNTWTELKAPKGTAASKICVDTDFKWPDERESLKARYPDFVNYVRDNLEVDSWWKDW